MFGRKKNKIIINSKYQINDFVQFKLNNDLKFGKINDIKQIDDIIYYEINVGGEAPYIARVEEDKISRKMK